MDNYADHFLQILKTAKTDDEIVKAINRIYEDGFQDGLNISTEE